MIKQTHKFTIPMSRKRTFSSYGPVSTTSNYYVPRTETVNRAVFQLVGEDPNEGGHYFTVWAPRQTGKTWILQQVKDHLRADNRFHTAIITAETLKETEDTIYVFNGIVQRIAEWVTFPLPQVQTRDEFKQIFTKTYFDKPLCLIIDEFDALEDSMINALVSVFRDIYLVRKNQVDNTKYLLHGVVLIGVRSVLGIDNKKGSPFNIQKSIHIPNLTFEEVTQMYDDYQREWEQKIDPEVVERLFYETNGQPGLVSWFGELMVEKYNKNYPQTIGMYQWNGVYSAGSAIEPNNTVLNLISKAYNPQYRELLSELFDTNEKKPFNFDNPDLNYLYMNGVILFEIEETENGKQNYFAKFSSPFVQKRLFNRFANDLYPNAGGALKPFENIDHIYNGKTLNIKNLLRRFERFLHENKTQLLERAPRRSDLRICEATFHFILYSWLQTFLNRLVTIIPEFPTGNGKIDLLLQHKTERFGLELKTFTNAYSMQQAMQQAAHYAKQLNLSETYLVMFIDSIDNENRTAIEIEYLDQNTGVKVYPLFITVNE